MFSNPLEVKTDVREALGLTSFTKSENPLPKTSYVPYCFFDKVYIFLSVMFFSNVQCVCRAQKTSGPFQNMGRSCSGEIRLLRWKNICFKFVIFKFFQDYEKELESVHGIPPAEIYKYPKCREFKQVSNVGHIECCYA